MSALPENAASVADQGALDADRPRFVITRGNPSDDELAAVVAVLAAASGVEGSIDTDGFGDRPRAAGWKSYHRVLRRPLVPGRDAWRTTFTH